MHAGRVLVVIVVAGIGLVGCRPGSAPAAAPAVIMAAPTQGPTPPTALSTAPRPSAATSPQATPAASAVVQAGPLGPGGEKLVEQSAETRFQLDLAVSGPILTSFTPPGWTPNVATTGPAKDANLRVVFIDRVTVNGPDGKPLGSTGTNRLIYLVAPVHDPTGATVQLVMGGLTDDPGDAPGPFGNYLAAQTHTMQRSTSSADGSLVDSQDWVFEAATGEHLELHVTYERGNAQRGAPADTKFYSAKTPSLYQLSRQEQVLDILRNVTTNPPDRVKEFSFKASGGSYARLFDGTERLLSWDNIVWLNRSVFAP